MKSIDIRNNFLHFFKQQGYWQRPSSLIVPDDDTLFFTNSGMVQFKPDFLRNQKPWNATTCQKCLRVSGKHNDFEEVGKSPRHHTFFEMLGNFRFSTDEKVSVIEEADHLMGWLGVDKTRLHITVHPQDVDAYRVWSDLVWYSNITPCPDNFWTMGNSGPCGPCTEVFYDLTPDLPRTNPIVEPNRYLEIWNIVFMQQVMDPDGTMKDTGRLHIDTGMGLERVASVLQGKTSNYDTDLFVPIIESIPANYGIDPNRDVSIRVIADHSRAIVFLLSEYVFPSEKDRGHVVKKIIRRAIRHAGLLGLNDIVAPVKSVIDTMSDVYPKLKENKTTIFDVLGIETDLYWSNLNRGSKVYLEYVKRNGGQTVNETFVKELKNRYGIYREDMQLIAPDVNIERFTDRSDIDKTQHVTVVQCVDTSMCPIGPALLDSFGNHAIIISDDFESTDGMNVYTTTFQHYKPVDDDIISKFETSHHVKVLDYGSSGPYARWFKYVAGDDAFNIMQQYSCIMTLLRKELGSDPVTAVKDLKEKCQSLERQLIEYKRVAADFNMESDSHSFYNLSSDVLIIASDTILNTVEEMRLQTDRLRDRFGPCIVVLKYGQQIVISVSAELSERYPAIQLLKVITAKSGGNNTMATGKISSDLDIDRIGYLIYAHCDK